MTFRKKGIAEFLFRIGEKIKFVPTGDPEGMYLRQDEFDSVKYKNHKIPLAVKSAVAKTSEQSFFINIYRRLVRSIFCQSVRSVGLLFFTSGFINILSYFLRRYIPRFAGSTHNLVLGVALVLISMITLPDKNTVGESIKNSLIFKAFISRTANIKAWEVPSESEKENEHRIIISAAGIILGCFFVISGPYKTLFAVLIAIISAIIIFKPESGLSFSLIFMLFSADRILIYLVVLTFISVLMKVLVGKRTVKFEKSDTVMFLFTAFITVYNAVSPQSAKSESFGEILVMVSFYFALRQFVKTVDSFKGLMYTLTLSLLIGTAAISVTGILEISGFKFKELLELATGAGEAFAVTKEAGILISMLSPVAVAFMMSSEKIKDKILGAVSLCFSLFALFFVESGGVWVAFFMGICMYLVLTRRKAIYFILVILLLGISVYSFIPKNFITDFLSKTGLDKWDIKVTSEVWKTGLENMIKGFPWGRGFGEEGTALFKSAGSFYISAGTSYGVGGILFIIAMIGCFFAKVKTFAKKTPKKDLHHAVCGAISAVFSLMLISVTGTFTDLKIIAVFFLYLAFPVSAYEACERERESVPY